VFEVFIVVLLIALASGSFLLIKRRRDASGISQELRSELRDAKRQLRRARTEHSTAVKAAEQDLKKNTKSYERQVDAAQKQLDGLQDARGKKLASFQKHTLFEHVIVTPNGDSALVGVRAEVDTAGNLTTKSRSTLTRMAAGGLVLGPLGSILSLGLKKTKEIDKRELYLLIDAPSASSVVQCPPDDGLKARQFATAVNAAATAEESYRQRLPALLDQARQHVQAAKGATEPVESARAELARATDDPDALASIEVAQRQLAAVERSLPTGERPALPPPPPGTDPPTPPPPSGPPPG
jgi:hypothetical protein